MLHATPDDALLPDPLKVPANVPAEQALLGAILMSSRKVLPAVEEILQPQHFYDPLHGAIYEVALKMYGENTDVNPVLIARHFQHSPLLQGVADPAAFFTNMTMSFVGVVNAADYALAIRDAWMRRELHQLCAHTAVTCCRPEDQGGEQIMEGLEEQLLKLVQGSTESQPNVRLHDALCGALEAAQGAVRRGQALAGMSWGYAGIDRMTNGLSAGNLYVIGARPAMGKTGFGLGVALRVASSGKRVLFWSGEMSPEQLGARAAAAFCGLPVQSVFSGRRWDVPDEAGKRVRSPLEAYQWNDLQNACDAAMKLPVEIDARPSITVARIRARARRMKRSKGGLDVIVLDYFGLMHGTTTARRGGRYEETTEISNDLKALARELAVPIVVLAQLNRETEKREDKRPIMSDLRDTGALEQDADVILFLHREHYYLQKAMAGGGLSKRDKETAEQFSRRCQDMDDRIEAARGKATIIIAKNRHGPAGQCRMLFDDATTWFRDVSEDERSVAWGEKEYDDVF